MREFMCHHINRNGKAIKNFAITVTKYHLLTVPEGVLIFFPVMDGTKQLQPLIIQRVTLISLPEKVIGDAEVVPGFFSRHIIAGGLALLSNQLTGQGFSALGIINFPVHMAARSRFSHGGLLPVFCHQVLNVGEGATRLRLLVTGTVSNDLTKDIGRNNTVSHLKLLGS